MKTGHSGEALSIEYGPWCLQEFLPFLPFPKIDSGACGACGRAFCARPRTLWETRCVRFPQVRRDPQARRRVNDRLSGSRSDDLESSHTLDIPLGSRIRRVGVAIARSRPLVQAIALALHLDDLSVGEKAIEDRGGRGDVAEKLAPVLRWTIRRNQC